MADDVTKLLQVKRTLAELLHTRGYNVTRNELEMTRDDFLQNYGAEPDRPSLSMMYRKRDLPEQIWVFFPKESKVRVKEIEEFYKRMKTEGINRAIIVFHIQITPYARQLMAKTKMIMEQFKEDELLVNITKHILVPQHIVLNDDEKAWLLAKYKLKETQLPRIQYSDAVARYLGLQRGQVVKIIRASETAGRYITYRFVV